MSFKLVKVNRLLEYNEDQFHYADTLYATQSAEGLLIYASDALTSENTDLDYIYKNLSIIRSLYSGSLGYYENLDDTLYHLSLTIKELEDLGDLSPEQIQQLSKILKEGQEEISQSLGGLTEREDKIEIITTGFKNLNTSLEDIVD